MDLIANTFKLRELLRGTVERLKNNSPQDYMTKYIRGKAKVEAANKRGFVTALDFEENGSFAYSDPNGGSLATPHKPSGDRITCNYQYIIVGSEITNESLAQSQAQGSVIGGDAKAEAMEKAAQRMLDMEEFYFCQGDGTQVFARITAGSVGTTITTSGAADGFGSYFIKKGGVVRIYDSTLTTLKGTRTVANKTSNGGFEVNSAITVVNGDLVLPEGDSVGTPTTAGIKGLPYIVGTPGGAYFDRNKTTNPNLAPIVDANAGALSRTKLENLETRYRIRNGQRHDGVDVTSPTQMSQYFALIIANTPTTNWTGDSRPAGDLGLKDWNFTWFGKRIRDFRFLPANAWYKLTLSSLCRVSLGTVGKMLTPGGDYIQKVANGAYVNAQQRWDDEFVEYFSPNPALNGALTNLTTTNLPMLKDDTRV